jgi:hypothetical protein
VYLIVGILFAMMAINFFRVARIEKLQVPILVLFFRDGTVFYAVYVLFFFRRARIDKRNDCGCSLRITSVSDSLCRIFGEQNLLKRLHTIINS